MLADCFDHVGAASRAVAAARAEKGTDELSIDKDRRKPDCSEDLRNSAAILHSDIVLQRKWRFNYCIHEENAFYGEGDYIDPRLDCQCFEVRSGLNDENRDYLSNFEYYRK